MRLKTLHSRHCIILLSFFLDQDSVIKNVSIDKFLDVFRRGIDQSHFVSMLMGEFEQASSLMNSVKSLFEAEGVSDEEIDNIVQEIDKFLSSSFNANNSISWFRDEKHEIEEHERRDIERLFNGWSKNEHEMHKRTKKLDNFRAESNEKLVVLEKSIEDSKERNEKFRKTLNETSVRISTLIEKLHDNTEKSDFIRKEIDIIDSTVGDLEIYKEKTHKEYVELEEQLVEKQNFLVDFLKKIDQNLDKNLSKHQQIIEKHDVFHEALEELADCYSDFELREQDILKKYNINSVDLILDTTRSSSSEIGEETVRFLEVELDKAVKKSNKIERDNQTLVLDLEELFTLNTNLTNENVDMKKRLSETQNEVDQLSKTVDHQITQIEKLLKENEKHEEINNLKARVDELLDENKSLRNTNTKTQDIYQENRELLDETSQLREDNNQIQAKLKSSEAKTDEQAVEIDYLHGKILDFEAFQKPRILNIKTKEANVLALNGRCNTSSDDSMEPPSLKELLQMEHDRNISLEQTNSKNQASANTLSTVCRRFGFDSLEPGKSYDVTIKSRGVNQVTATYSGITLSSKELHSIKVRGNDKDDTDLSKAKECIIDELSSMLQESYQQSNDTIAENKQLQNQLSILRLEMKHQKESVLISSPPSLLASSSEEFPDEITQKVKSKTFINNKKFVA